MTMTIKLAPEMEQQLRRRSAMLGKPASALSREALTAYLESSADLEASAYALGSPARKFVTVARVFFTCKQ